MDNERKLTTENEDDYLPYDGHFELFLGGTAENPVIEGFPDDKSDEERRRGEH